MNANDATGFTPEGEPAHGVEQLLDRSPWAATLTAPERRRLLGEIHLRTLAPGMHAVRKGEPCEAWLGIVEGLVKINTVSPEGKSVTFTGVSAGGWLGEGSLLKNERRKYDVVAMRTTRVAYMPRATFQRLLDTDIAFNRYLLVQLNERLGQFIAMVEYDRLLGCDERVARCLAELFNPVLYPGAGTRLQISQEEIGFLSGCSRQRANQALRRLEAVGLVKLGYGGVEVLDLDGLKGFTVQG